MKTLIDHRRLADVPVLEFYNPEAAQPLPVVLLMHGFSGRKEHLFQQGYGLAQRGYLAVALDLHLHGESAEGDFDPARIGPRLEEIVARSAASIADLVCLYGDHPCANGERVGLVGVSLGGAVIYRYLPQRQPQVRAVVTLIAGAQPFWPVTLRRVMQHYPEFGVTEAMLAWAEQRIPTGTFLEGVNDTPLLLQVGQEDPIVPIEEIRALLQQLKGRYVHPERLELIEYPGVRHETPAAMFAAAWEWLDRWL